MLHIRYISNKKEKNTAPEISFMEQGLYHILGTLTRLDSLNRYLINKWGQKKKKRISEFSPTYSHIFLSF